MSSIAISNFQFPVSSYILLPMSSVSLSVEQLKGIGKKRAEQLARLGIYTIADLLLTLPHRYEDRRSFMPIARLRSVKSATVSGSIMACGWVKNSHGKDYFEAVVSDTTGVVHCRWYNARYLKDILRNNMHLILFGKVSAQRGEQVFYHPDYEIVEESDESHLHMGRITPVYPLTEHVTQRWMRKLLWQVVEEFADTVKDIMPAAVRQRHRLMSMSEALHMVHFPESPASAEKARYRIIFDMFLCMQLVLVAQKIKSERFLSGQVHKGDPDALQQFVEGLPFNMTHAQHRVIQDVVADMEKPHPMHRLLQGDVGSGKTVVAAYAVVKAVTGGSQCAVMAPTEILATQHYHTLSPYLESLNIRSVLLTGDLKAKKRNEIIAAIGEGSTDVVIGTHAIIQDAIEFKDLGLVIIDEQHKFGVAQRGILYEKGGNPDVLVMTATPIPRSLAMTVYGDLDVSMIDELPPGRVKIVTRVIRESKLPDAYAYIKKQVAKGRQAYLVYPLVAESEKMDLKSAEAMFEKLNNTIFSQERLGLLHGQMSNDDKDDVMRRFKEGTIDILVATTVIEVGIDVPNATIMLIENAERFGLAQLHQLRGRIGRSSLKSYCILQGNPSGVDSWKRLRIMEETTDGFRIAEEDLRIRGMGNLLGSEQSGFPTMKVGDPVTDVEILKTARKEAFCILENDPKLEKPENHLLREQARAYYHKTGNFIRVG